MAIETCAQTQCLMHEPGVDSRSLSEMIVRVLAGQAVEVGQPIAGDDRCVECVMHVLRGAIPVPTLDEVRQSQKSGQRSYRRVRRRDQRGVV